MIYCSVSRSFSCPNTTLSSFLVYSYPPAHSPKLPTGHGQHPQTPRGTLAGHWQQGHCLAASFQQGDPQTIWPFRNQPVGFQARRWGRGTRGRGGRCGGGGVSRRWKPVVSCVVVCVLRSLFCHIRHSLLTPHLFIYSHPTHPYSSILKPRMATCMSLIPHLESIFPRCLPITHMLICASLAMSLLLQLHIRRKRLPKRRSKCTCKLHQMPRSIAIESRVSSTILVPESRVVCIASFGHQSLVL
jgi:hypothetical protein